MSHSYRHLATQVAYLTAADPAMADRRFIGFLDRHGVQHKFVFRAEIYKTAHPDSSYGYMIVHYYVSDGGSKIEIDPRTGLLKWAAYGVVLLEDVPDCVEFDDA